MLSFLEQDPPDFEAEVHGGIEDESLRRDNR